MILKFITTDYRFIMLRLIFASIIFIVGLISPSLMHAEEHLTQSADSMNIAIDDSATIRLPVSLSDTILTEEFRHQYGNPTLYDLPYSRTLSIPNWKHLWINTGVLVGAGVTTMIILEALPSDATAWNKKENAKTSMWKRWVRNVKAGPVWDKDNLVFNYLLHPYAGAAYYMGARSCGFNCWGSFLYSFCISSFFWEYGFEAFNEIPSVQDLVVTPLVGSILGEGFYLLKRHIVERGYRLWGSRVLGYAVAFLVDPLNECIGYFRGDQRHQIHRTEAVDRLKASSWIAPSSSGLSGGISLTYTF
ncbi:MAG: DUF3943 domain-containing protein [Bacteroides sp.]|nr:DUF3943 domain-containing protein [Bacteroides sp.]MCM1414071.1 DUF3943 domain-containing protein [Bacteroides sp.]MCM1472330.1 DUF3943 domain-containing protein [Bacteroides sp.]